MMYIIDDNTLMDSIYWNTWPIIIIDHSPIKKIPLYLLGKFDHDLTDELLFFRGVGQPPEVIFHMFNYQRVQCGAPKIAKLVYNSNHYGLWYL